MSQIASDEPPFKKYRVDSNVKVESFTGTAQFSVLMII